MKHHLSFKNQPALLLCCIVLLMLTACGTVTSPIEEGVVLEEDQVELSSDPGSPAAGQETQLMVELGAPVPNDTRIDFEIRKEGSARGKFLKTDKISGQTYTAEETFQDSGTYRVFIHIYSSNIHQTMEKRIEVQ